jgi:hypothetical protein
MGACLNSFWLQKSLARPAFRRAGTDQIPSGAAVVKALRVISVRRQAEANAQAAKPGGGAGQDGRQRCARDHHGSNLASAEAASLSPLCDGFAGEH